jgi:DNA polymerase-3 subunit epsilon
MLNRFNDPWHAVPLCVIDTECTGKQPGRDRAVSFGIARFENGVFVAGLERLVNPGMLIPAESTEIHGITDAMVADAPTLHDAFYQADVAALLGGAQPAAYNAAFDRHFIPPFGERWDWPFLDVLKLIQKVDRRVPGKGRHKLSVTCLRHGIELTHAHSAGADARACGELLYEVGRHPQAFPKGYTLGQAIDWCRRAEVEEWFRFNAWLSQQPPLQTGAA